MQNSKITSLIFIFKLDSVINWFYIPIGIWVLYYSTFLNFTQIGTAYAIGLFFGTLLELPSGAIADMIGRKKTIVIGRFFLIIGYIFLANATSLWHFIVFQLCYNIDAACSSGAQSALLYDHLKENGVEKKLYKKIETDTFALCTIGMAIGSIVGGILYSHYFRLPFFIMIGISTIGFITSLFYKEPHLDSVKFTFKNYISQNWQGAKHIFATPEITLISFFTFAINFTALSALWYIYEPRLAEGHFSATTLSIVVAGTYLIRAIGTKLIPKVEHHISHHNLPLFLALTQAIGSALSFFSGRFGAISSVYLRKFSDGFRHPFLLTLQNDEIDSKYRATALSALALIVNLSLTITGPLIGFLIQTHTARVTMGLFTIIGLFISTPLSIKLKQNLQNK